MSWSLALWCLCLCSYLRSLYFVEDFCTYVHQENQSVIPSFVVSFSCFGFKGCCSDREFRGFPPFPLSYIVWKETKLHTTPWAAVTDSHRHGMQGVHSLKIRPWEPALLLQRTEVFSEPAARGVLNLAAWAPKPVMKWREGRASQSYVGTQQFANPLGHTQSQWRMPI